MLHRKQNPPRVMSERRRFGGFGLAAGFLWERVTDTCTMVLEAFLESTNGEKFAGKNEKRGQEARFAIASSESPAARFGRPRKARSGFSKRGLARAAQRRAPREGRPGRRARSNPGAERRESESGSSWGGTSESAGDGSDARARAPEPHSRGSGPRGVVAKSDAFAGVTDAGASFAR